MGLFEELGAGARSAACDILRNNLYLVRVFRRNNVVLDTLSGYNAARFLFERFCNEPHPNPPASPPFAGGRCPVIYLVTVRWTAPSLVLGVSDYDDTSFNPVGGPISGLYVEAVTSGLDERWEMGIDATDPNLGTPSRFQARSIDRLTWGQPTGTILSIVRDDGLPDDCGDLGDDVLDTAPLPPPQPITINYFDNDNNLVFFNGFLTLGFAYFDNDLNVHIPVNIDVPISVNPNFNFGFNFDIDFNLGDNSFTIKPPAPPGERPPLPPGRPPGEDPGDPRPEPPPPPPPPDVPKPPDREEDSPPEPVIRGVLVTVVSDEDALTVGGLAQGDNPNIAIPNYGYVNFFTRLNGSVGGWSPDLPVKNARTLITCPWPGGAQRVEGTPRPGVQWVITPVYGPGGFLGIG